ncbi:MAG: GNAT family N-acetyltransferase [Lentisphaeria bacterium]|nr:GNAT family N-acetyltransferase [Lentisphaeria bacterium]
MMTSIMQTLRSDKVQGNIGQLLHLPVRRESPVLAEQENFRLKLAESPVEVEAALRLRYRVFKEEQGRLANCTGGIDRDRFDRYCRHLLVVDKESEKVVGTYRVLSGSGAAAAGSFYSEEEFSIAGLHGLRHEVCEVGRSCVAPEFRSGAVVGLLWSGLAALRRRPKPSRSLIVRYARRRRRNPEPAFHYLFGCVSLEATDQAAALALYEYFRRNGQVSDKLHAKPRPGFMLDAVPQAEVNRYLEEHAAGMIRTLPPLFKGYIKLGAKVCGAPAYDREFGTIDFLILLDMREMPERYAKHFAK